MEKTKNERDFHHKAHMQMVREGNQKQNNDFLIGQLKREVHYLDQEKKDWSEYKLELERQINELLFMAEKPRNEKQTYVENYYTKKLVEKEEVIKTL